MAKHDKIALVRVGDKLALMVEVYPTMMVLALEETQARSLANTIYDMLDGAGATEETPEEFMERILRGKKPEGAQ